MCSELEQLRVRVEELATSVAETVNDTKYRGATAKYYDGSIDQELAALEMDLWDFIPSHSLERIYHRFLRVNFVELRRRIVNVQMWELSKNYIHFTDGVFDHGEPARSKIVGALSKTLGTEFITSFAVDEKLIIKDHGSNGSKVFATIMLNPVGLDAQQIRKIMTAIEHLPQEKFMVESLALPYLGQDYIHEKYKKRYDDLQSDHSPYKN